ncbi:hypothetical protein SAMN02745975_00521 [Geosporobacter subterraneus DSM 17957]|uniref:Uncharacterized protein n=1 Tax=Geosporobacter subterraneus DSM 17957 TaxID=1121919 RepID=A0A1M6DNX0_9FIRM|nr:hypothetical protein [Geosporobacter subterraneus]SHI74875.1 hypothetical protein SAMN02745975_00521 [Geosporobacter subterraneus DSM 17957]
MGWPEVKILKDHIDSKIGYEEYYSDKLQMILTDKCKIDDNGDVILGPSIPGYTVTAFAHDVTTNGVGQQLYGSVVLIQRLLSTFDKKNGIRKVEQYFDTATGTPPSTSVTCEIFNVTKNKSIGKAVATVGSTAGFKTFDFSAQIIEYDPTDIVDVRFYMTTGTGDSSNCVRIYTTTTTISNSIRLNRIGTDDVWYQQTAFHRIKIEFVDRTGKVLKGSFMEKFEVEKVQKFIDYKKQVSTPSNTEIKSLLAVKDKIPPIVQDRVVGQTSAGIYDTTGRIAKRFSFTEAKLLEKIDVVLNGPSNADYVLNVEVQKSDGNNIPDGVPIGTTASFNMNGLGSGYKLLTFLLNAKLEANQEYFVVFYLTDIGASMTSSHIVNFGYITATSYTGFRYYGGASWSTISNSDLACIFHTQTVIAEMANGEIDLSSLSPRDKDSLYILHELKRTSGSVESPKFHYGVLAYVGKSQAAKALNKILEQLTP